ncbi:CNTN2 [Branchiostoma lanceolatum]|uniref:CNTN2 protein n=1 Tax=Branchiostoma lanceolatum TaxID=7740 RepID=A0A8J9VL28_BRALA|nr:CNTN2 [Branchiostoma lanceolatum]
MAVRPPLLLLSVAILYYVTLTEGQISGQNPYLDPRSQIIAQDVPQQEPLIIHEPKDVVYNPGGERKYAVMQCAAIGNPEPTYEWERDSVPVQVGERYSIVGGNLTIMNPSNTTDIGTYRCTAINSVGREISRTATLKFAFVGEWDRTARDPKTVNEGSLLSVTCNPPAAHPGLKYSWYKDNNFVIPSHRVHISDLTGDLYIASARESDAGSYRCRAMSADPNADSNGNTEDQFSPPTVITVNNQQNLFDTQPVMAFRVEDVTVVRNPTAEEDEEASVTMECFATGRPVPTISWERMDAPLPPKARPSNSRLVITDVTQDEAGTYRCTARNNLGSVSDDARIIFNSPPEFLDFIPPEARGIGETVTFQCPAVRGTRPLRYSWFAGDEPITSDIRIKVGASTLTINNIRESDHGRYQCHVENEYGTAQVSAELSVRDIRPRFFSPVSSVLAVEGGKAVLRYNSRAAPTPTIQWKKGTSSIQQGNKYNITSQGYLVINDIRTNDAGLYTVSVINDLGSASSTGEVRVVEATVITTSPSDTTIDTGGLKTLRCTARTDRRLDVTYTWLVNDRRLEVNDSAQYYERGSNGDLIIKNADPSLSGTYTCSAESGGLTVQASCTVTVQGPRGAPLGVNTGGMGSNWVELQWLPVPQGDSAVEYVIEGVAIPEPKDPLAQEVWEQVKRGSVSGLRTTRALPSGTKSVNVSGLSSNTLYKFRVMELNPFGLGEPSLPTGEIRTLPASPTKKPVVGGGGGIRDDLRITWEPFERRDYGGPGFGYRVMFRRRGVSTWGTDEIRTNASVALASFVHGPVPNYVPYDVKVQAFNDLGNGPESDMVTVYSSGGPPGKINGIRVLYTSHSNATLSFSPPQYRGNLLYYVIRYWKSNERANSSYDPVNYQVVPIEQARVRPVRYTELEPLNPYVWPIPADEEPRRYRRNPDEPHVRVRRADAGPHYGVVTGLESNQQYMFSARARTDGGRGDYSREVPGTTLANAAQSRAAAGGLLNQPWLPTLLWVFLALLIFLALLCCCLGYYWYKNVRHTKLKTSKVPAEISMDNMATNRMTHAHKKQLLRHKPALVKTVDPEPVIHHLVQKEAIPKSMAGQIRSPKKPEEAHERLLTVLPSRPDPAFFHYCDAVRKQDAGLADQLERKTPSISGSGENGVFSSMPLKTPTGSEGDSISIHDALETKMKYEDLNNSHYSMDLDPTGPRARSKQRLVSSSTEDEHPSSLVTPTSSSDKHIYAEVKGKKKSSRRQPSSGQQNVAFQSDDAFQGDDRGGFYDDTETSPKSSREHTNEGFDDYELDLPPYPASHRAKSRSGSSQQSPRSSERMDLDLTDNRGRAKFGSSRQSPRSSERMDLDPASHRERMDLDPASHRAKSRSGSSQQSPRSSEGMDLDLAEAEPVDMTPQLAAPSFGPRPSRRQGPLTPPAQPPPPVPAPASRHAPVSAPTPVAAPEPVYSTPSVEPHPFEAQSGQRVTAEDGWPVIIEVYGPADEVRWLYEGRELPNCSQYQQESESPECHLLHINGVNRQNAGVYTCQGTIYGEGTVSCDVIIDIAGTKSKTGSYTNMPLYDDDYSLHPRDDYGDNGRHLASRV